jgi:hypothetical protein
MVFNCGPKSLHLAVYLPWSEQERIDELMKTGRSRLEKQYALQGFYSSMHVGPLTSPAVLVDCKGFAVLWAFPDLLDSAQCVGYIIFVRHRQKYTNRVRK